MAQLLHKRELDLPHSSDYHLKPDFLFCNLRKIFFWSQWLNEQPKKFIVINGLNIIVAFAAKSVSPVTTQQRLLARPTIASVSKLVHNKNP